MSGEQDRIDIAQAAAQQLRETGINCTVEIPAQMDWGGQMACLIGWGSPFDADEMCIRDRNRPDREKSRVPQGRGHWKCRSLPAFPAQAVPHTYRY